MARTKKEPEMGNIFEPVRWVLADSGVEFNEEEHTYHLNGKQLQGITGVINSKLYPNKFANISKAVLDKAAERGKEIHKEVEMSVNGFESASPDEGVKDFLEQCGERGIKLLEAEYVVSDGMQYASPVDVVDGCDNLYDIKTTSVLDKEYLSWQLSIYAMFFELMNGRKAGNLFGVHIRNGKCVIVPIERRSNEDIRWLLYDEPLPLPTDTDVERSNRLSNLAAKLETIEIKIKGLQEEVATYEEEEAVLKAELMEVMNDSNMSKYSQGALSLTLKSAYVTKKVDSKRLKEEMPDIFNLYSKTTNIKQSLTIKVNDGNGAKEDC